MNAAAQRRMTPWLMVAVGVLGALFLGLLVGLGRHVYWNPVSHPEPLPVMQRLALPVPSQPGDYAIVWQHPLFNSDRQPVPDHPVIGNGVDLGNLELTGIILTPGLRMALMRDKNAGKNKDRVRVRLGDPLPGSQWKLAVLKPRMAIFTSGVRRAVLSLPRGAPMTPLVRRRVNRKPAKQKTGRASLSKNRVQK